jgi:serine/threonine protein kinase/tetratricopeptide (TPR) repeat protein
MIGATLDNYRILEKLGAGGQGEVYKAVDKRLGRSVVIKVLPPDLTVKEANLKRFEREARLASSLDHPNICTIYDLGEQGNVHYIAMQYIEGRNVRQLVNGRPLEIKSALSIAMQVADALASAHSKGIIHRDIKAGNVMVTDSGQAKVLDFGLAKLLDEDAARNEGIHHTELTEIGIPYGTATYAAPEQARGDRVDKRADIFSTGVLLYEMLTGIWPFQGQNSVEVRHAVIHDQPKPVAEMRKDYVPPRLQQMLDHALQKEPGSRYQKMEEFRDDLKSVLRELNGGAQYIDEVQPIAPRHLPGTGGPISKFKHWLRNVTGTSEIPRTAAPHAAHPAQQASQDPHETPLTSLGDEEKKSVAILPFKNLSKDAASGFYEFSLADAVITELAQVKSLVVRPSSVIVKYQGTERDPRDAGRELNVSAVLAAGFLKAGDRIRVTAQLLDVSTGDLLWSDRIDADSADIITVQDTIARRIVEGLRLELSPAEKDGLAQAATANADAYDEYLRGRDRMGRFIYHTLAREDVDAAIKHFKNATQLDPNFALAHSALGGCHANLVRKGFGDAEDYHLAEEEFDKALALDPKNFEARMHMVFIYMSRGEKRQARELLSQLRREMPNDVGVHFVSGVLRRLDGDYDGALRSFERMVKLNPAERVVASYNRARVFLYQHRLEDALLELDQGAAVEPDHPLIKTFRAVMLYYRGAKEAAVKLLEEVLQKNPRLDGIRPIYAMYLRAQGRYAEARAQITEQVKDVASADHDSSFWLASFYALEGERDLALEWLERSINLGNENKPWFEADPNWEAFHNDPRFQELMQKIERSRPARRG